MLYLSFDKDGYFEAVTYRDEEQPGVPGVEALGDLDCTSPYAHAYKWDGEKLVLDGDKLARIKAEEKKQADEKEREAALKEVQAAIVTAQINTVQVDDATALRWRLLYPEWAVNRVYIEGDRVQYEDRLYRCLQGHSSQIGWEPTAAASLWTEVCESHAGTADDPIPYSGNMALENGKYYVQDGVTYRCTRDTINPVYNALKDLVGLYVEVAEG